MLVRTAGAGATHAFLDWLHGQRLSYSVGFSLLPYDAEQVLAQVPASVWTPAYDGDGQVRDGAYVAELTGLLNLKTWPPGMRVIARKERPHPGAQLTLTDVDGMRVTAFATNTACGTGCSPSPPRSPEAADECCSTSPTSPHGPSSSSTPSPGSTPSPSPADRRNLPTQLPAPTPAPVEAAPTETTSAKPSHP